MASIFLNLVLKKYGQGEYYGIQGLLRRLPLPHLAGEPSAEAGAADDIADGGSLRDKMEDIFR